jgi:3-oxoacyl-[acyl-carrier protein] reductase
VVKKHMQLTDKVALVTGAGGGIGKATALELARRGAAVALNYRRSREGAESTVAAIEAQGGHAMAYECDVTQAADVRSMIASVEREFGRLDILVNNAGDLIERRT